VREFGHEGVGPDAELPSVIAACLEVEEKEREKKRKRGGGGEEEEVRERSKQKNGEANLAESGGGAVTPFPGPVLFFFCLKQRENIVSGSMAKR